MLAAEPECAVYTAMADNRLPDALEDYRRILAAGINVVGSAAVFLQYPWQVLPEELVSPAGRGCGGGKVEPVCHRDRPGLRQ